MQAKEATERDAPKEVRILKWIVSIEGERDREQELDKAFKPVRASLSCSFDCAITSATAALQALHQVHAACKSTVVN